MKKKKLKHRVLRKCEKGIKTKSFNKGFRYLNGKPVMWCNDLVF